ncbi:hypothetical protein QBE53_06395 [Vallitaleaceae bacterium 9-2]
MKVLLNVSRYGKGIAESESNEMLELMDFHEFLSQELFAMSFQFSDNGTLTADQHNDLTDLEHCSLIFVVIYMTMKVRQMNSMFGIQLLWIIKVNFRILDLLVITMNDIKEYCY